jgi:hypothetical protein
MKFLTKNDLKSVSNSTRDMSYILWIIHVNKKVGTLLCKKVNMKINLGEMREVFYSPQNKNYENINL